jgi:lipopolysaccharide export system protein LptA
MLPAQSFAAEQANTTITSKKMVVRNQENKAIFEGDVILTKGNLTVQSDVMVVLFKSTADAQTNGLSNSSVSERSVGAPAGDRSISSIEASGSVVIRKEDGHAMCQKAVYFKDEEKIVLTGKPVAWQKGARVSGRKITMYLAEDRSVVEGDSQVYIEPQSAP